MNLYPTRTATIEHEIRRPLAERLEDLLSDPLPGGDGSPASLTYPTVEDYYDVAAIADEVLELFVTGGGARPPLYCLRPDIYPSLFWEIAEKHARPADA